MRYPNFSFEKKLSKAGYQRIVGIDEVGRGAWAGPLVAVATRIPNFKPPISQIPPTGSGAGTGTISKQILNLNPRLDWGQIPKIKDSKLLSEKVREAMFEKLSERVIWSIGIVSHKEIDQKGLSWANTIVIKRAIKNLPLKPDYLLIDNINGFRHSQPHQLIIDGDKKVLSIAIASILAKVTRDRLMRGYHLKFPQYHFYKHKGYGTKLHQQCLQDHGVCRIHRLSYRPVKKFIIT